MASKPGTQSQGKVEVPDHLRDVLAHVPATAAPPTYDAPVVVEVMVKVRALAFAEPEGGYSVVVPEIPGCVTQGEDIAEVEAMVRDLADALLEMRHDESREQAVRAMNAPLPGEARP